MAERHMSLNRRIVRSATTVALFCSIAAIASPASAVDASVRLACARDYFAYCNKYEVGSDALRQCMRSQGAKLTPRCIDALANAGEISRADQQRHQQAQRSAQR